MIMSSLPKHNKKAEPDQHAKLAAKLSNVALRLDFNGPKKEPETTGAKKPRTKRPTPTPITSAQSSPELDATPDTTDDHDSNESGAVTSGYKMLKGGLFVESVDEKGKKAYTRVSDRFDVIGNVSAVEGSSYGVVIDWQDDRGRQHRRLIELRSFAAGDIEIIAPLLAEGLRIDDRRKFVDYLWRQAKTAKKAHLTTKPGWFDEHRYVHPDGQVIYTGLKSGDEDEDASINDRILFMPTSKQKNLLRSAGTLKEWRDHVAALCRQNSRLLYCVSLGFAPALLNIVKAESSGSNLRGPTSIGKTTAASIACSVSGCQLHSWHCTANAMEVRAADHSDGLLVLDDIQQSPSTDIVGIVYMLGNNQPKGRMNADGSGRDLVGWRLEVLSSGEKTMSEHAGRVTKGGAENRFLDIPAEATPDSLFEYVHGRVAQDGKKPHQVFADELKANTKRFYGTAFRHFLNKLCKLSMAECIEKIETYRADFRKQLGIETMSPETGRALSRFSLIAAAGELATSFGTTGWEPGEARDGVITCCRAWLDNRGGSDVFHDREQALIQVRLHFQKFGNSRYEVIRDDARSGIFKPVAGLQPVYNRAGFRRVALGEEDQFLCFKDVFRNEICKGLSYKKVAGWLVESGDLIRQGRDHTVNTTAGGLPKDRYYCIRAKILGGTEPADNTDCQIDPDQETEE